MDKNKKAIVVSVGVLLLSTFFYCYEFRFLHQKDTGVSYEINSKGELIKKFPSGGYIGLVTLSEMQNDFIVDNWSSNENKIYPFVRGKVLDYWVSPDGNYIAYSVQVGLTSCCMSPPTGKSNRLKIMRSDGTGKRLIDETPRGGAPYVSFDGWLPNSKGFIFHDWFPDESTQGSPFFLASVDGSPNKFFDSIDYGDQEVTGDSYAVIVALAEPYFSPKDNLMVYRKEGIYGGTLILSDIDGTGKKVLLDDLKEGIMSYTKWSPDGKWVDITVGDEKNATVYRFNKNGERIK